MCKTGLHKVTSGRRPIKATVWNTLEGAVVRQWNKLPDDSPRKKPTLPVLKFLRETEERG